MPSTSADPLQSQLGAPQRSFRERLTTVGEQARVLLYPFLRDSRQPSRRHGALYFVLNAACCRYQREGETPLQVINAARVEVLTNIQSVSPRNPQLGRRLAELIAQGDPGGAWERYELLHDAHVAGRLEEVCNALNRRGQGWDFRLCAECEFPLHPNENYLCEPCREDRYQEESSRLPSYGSCATFLHPIRAVVPEGKRKPINMGIEVELEYDGYDIEESCANITAHLEAHVGSSSVGYEEDGSLSHGAEFVFGWGSLESWRDCIADILADELCRFSRYNFAPERTCGLHVHASPVPSVAPLSRLLYLVNHVHHEDFWELLAGRPFGHYCGKKQVEDWPQKGRLDLYGMRCGAENNGSRYDSVSLTEKPTLEFRLFAGTARWTTILRQLETVDALMRHCVKPAALEDMTPGRFAKWVVARAKTYPNLAAFLSKIGYPKESTLCA